MNENGKQVIHIYEGNEVFYVRANRTKLRGLRDVTAYKVAQLVEIFSFESDEIFLTPTYRVYS